MITQTLDLNLIPGRVLPMVNVSQYDKDSRTLEFTIYNGDASFDLTGLSAYIQGLKPDGHGFNYSATVGTGKITADVTEQMTAVSGRVMCEVIIMSGTDRIGTGNFILNVEAAAMPDGSNMSDSDYAYVEQLIEDAQQAVEDAQAEVENAEAWANGTRDGQTIPATDPAYQKNSKYWSEQASDYSEDAESWANGTRDGQTITSTDPAYQKNSKYWSEQSASYVEDAEAWAVGTRNGTPVPSGSPEYENNAAYWANEARNVAQQTTYTEMDDSLALVPTSAGNALPLTIYGQSTQDGTPTPSSPVAIESASADFKCVGKNLIPYPYVNTSQTINNVNFTDNGNGSISADNAASATTQFRLYGWTTGLSPILLRKGTYILSGCPSGGGSNSLRLYLHNQDSSITIVDDGEGAQFTLSDDTYVGISIRVANGYDADGKTVYPMLRLASVADATYEPYKHTDITTSLTLRAIEVTSSDDYNLVKDGKYYIADTIDWDEVDGYTLTQRIKVMDMGDIDYYHTDNRYQPTSAYYNENIGVKGPDSGRSVMIACEAFKAEITAADGTCFIAQSLFIICYTSAMTAAEFKTHFTGNKLYFALATPTKTSLTSAQAKALLSMRTYDESTSIDAVNSPAPVLELEYAKTRTPALALTGHNMAHINAIDIGDM